MDSSPFCHSAQQVDHTSKPCAVMQSESVHLRTHAHNPANVWQQVLGRGANSPMLHHHPQSISAQINRKRAAKLQRRISSMAFKAPAFTAISPHLYPKKLSLNRISSNPLFTLP